MSILVVTDGPSGSLARFTTPQGELGNPRAGFPSQPCPPRNTNRTGEAFEATFISTLLSQGWQPASGVVAADLVRQAMIRAAAAAALVLDRTDFGFPAPEAIDIALPPAEWHESGWKRCRLPRRRVHGILTSVLLARDQRLSSRPQNRSSRHKRPSDRTGEFAYHGGRDRSGRRAGGAGMKHVRSLRFEALKARQLLSRAHVHAAVAHAARPAATPVALNGTLNVDNNPNATTTTTNVDGSMTTSVPVAGQVAGLGEVHGIWDETVDSFGDYEGPDTLILHASNGAFGVAFNNENSPERE